VLGSVRVVNAIEMACSCKEIYGSEPTTAIPVTSAAMLRLLPYREERKSEIEVMLYCLLMMMMRWMIL